MVTTTPISGLARDAGAVHNRLLQLDRPFYLVRDAQGVAACDSAVPGVQVLAAVPPLPAPALGDKEFLTDHGVGHAYMAGSMANRIASADMVIALAEQGFLASYGAAGVVAHRVDADLARIRAVLRGRSFACNLIHSPNEPAMERSTIDLCLMHEVRTIEASAFLDLTPQIVRYRIAGLTRGVDGTVVAGNKVIAKVSRTEVAEKFLRPAPEAMVRELLASGAISAEQAEWSRQIPVADDITAEADSGGHTDRRPLMVLLPEIISVRGRVQRELGYPQRIRIGAAGGIGTPAAAAAAFALGSAYVVTGSINQATVEAGQSWQTKRLLAGAGVNDCDMAPSADMFEMGVEVQVLKRGTMFATKAKRLYDVYRAHDGIEQIPAAERNSLEERIFQRPLDDVWQECITFFQERDPGQISRAQDNPKRRMALIFRWYLGLSSGWSISGNEGRVSDYQVWCGPAMGAFNNWAGGTYLAAVENRRAAELATHVMRGAAFTSRVTQLRLAGARLPASACSYVPEPLELGTGRNR
ncbi:PfaD family polyunsaturated fatty acid/polyketide biosynthesis protein [Saccharopolyspora sp. ASAGF58]|uniref:PfaD family polyunsaturated fatty acid/polyketide biosynthesis protein n=1 Tax=Saccharopolyspora sp. ASAGF58 TaxID=2719023 RepID=UPI00143FE0B4|nr:PfaD family polyunsaturated fatty acid/polyketide biosynthesis protein [Saccharopolyspora sp. ASAGF58]QIZ38710.1 PfaD family polyunsaturated fatty acid/polyketide biosynthesis protein [Saccharopolyspora sp. ASAGF58]